MGIRNKGNKINEEYNIFSKIGDFKDLSIIY